MDKLILIDGNSLLNRAFYAVRPFTTSDGLPTNGIFGFLKLLLKILDDEAPRYLAVAFDLHAPTFRHKLSADYKATRKPMPEELAVQVPVLKDLLAAMGICMVEREGYEADDLIGTLSRKFERIQVLIYTGDRDAYQLVNETVSVCFTKRGVSEIDLLTFENFYEKVGLTPFQIIEEKALMGDTSDNIPGVKGIGPKLAIELLTKYGTAENVLHSLDLLSASLRAKLEGAEEIVRLSHTLATIDTAVPLALTLPECEIKTPFPEAAREILKKLEFRSMLDSDYFPEPVHPQEIVFCQTLHDADAALESVRELAFCMEDDGVHLGIGEREYIFSYKADLIGNGFFLEELIPLFRKLFSGDKKILVSDLKSVMHRLSELGLKIECPVEDVSLLRYLADSNQRTATPRDFAKEYSLSEKNAACAVERAFRDAVEKTRGTPEETLYRELEIPLIEVLFEMERTGVAVDEAKFSEFDGKYRSELASIADRIYLLAGEKFNLNSPTQLSEILFTRLGFNTSGVKKTARGYSTNADILERLAEKHEIAALILRYRELSKLQTTYIEGIRPLVRDGIVHTTYNQMMTTTGRLSSANPNLQNIPVRRDEGRELRKLFIAREGNVLVDADYSQIELRLLAHFSGCPALQEAYLQEKDIHAATASQVFGVPIDSVTPLLRRRAKAVNFGIIYGISAFGLAKDLGCTASEAQDYINHYFATYPEVKQYMEENVRRAKEDGYVTTVLGRKRYIPEIKSANRNLRAFGERAAMNMPLQGSSADIIKLAMLGVFRRLKREGMSAKLVLQVHDELVLDAPAEERELAEKVLKEEMEGAVRLSIPLTADVSSGVNWYDAK